MCSVTQKAYTESSKWPETFMTELESWKQKDDYVTGSVVGNALQSNEAACRRYSNYFFRVM